MIQTDNFKKVEVASSQELRSWLEKYHQQQESVWLVTFKKSVPDKYLSTSAVLDELLCFGWIDGIRRKLDDTRTMQLISPRKVEHWAKSYKDRAAKLIKEGKMQEAGFRSIALSKQTGLWDFMDDVDKLIVPQDLLDALRKNEGAEVFFHAINDSSKRFVLRWIKLAKTEKTRASRVEQIAQLSAKGEKLKGS
ncbi:MAG: YdeI/OmpD-associated family protein [Cyclobacteriaceae bacterium]|nr:YdeI/OmpD-associated family protein [Cyclobacteriaceae bacterium]